MHQSNIENFTAKRPAGRAGYAEWIALGAIAAGSISAIIGMANCSRSKKSFMDYDEMADSSMVTSPHGDKLGAVV